jgi:flagellar biosynthesis protein FlhA
MDTSSLSPRAVIDALKKGDLLFVFALFGTVVLLVLPVPAVVLDLLLAMSIGISLLMLLIIIYVKDPPEFSGFPTLLLAVTLYRLSLNVASTRLILIEGHAGSIIDAFGQFVVRGNFVVGAVVFLILIVINFMVITKGAGRIAEVAARFTLDAMPGSSMSPPLPCAGAKCRPKLNSTAPWTAPASSSAATPSPASSLR